MGRKGFVLKQGMLASLLRVGGFFWDRRVDTSTVAWSSGRGVGDLTRVLENFRSCRRVLLERTMQVWAGGQGTPGDGETVTPTSPTVECRPRTWWWESLTGIDEKLQTAYSPFGV